MISYLAIWWNLAVSKFCDNTCRSDIEYIWKNYSILRVGPKGIRRIPSYLFSHFCVYPKQNRILWICACIIRPFRWINCILSSIKSSAVGRNTFTPPLGFIDYTNAFWCFDQIHLSSIRVFLDNLNYQSDELSHGFRCSSWNSINRIASWCIRLAID